MLLVLALVFVSACSTDSTVGDDDDNDNDSATDDDDSAASDDDDDNDSSSDNVGGGKELSDGSIGSSCGKCQAGLTCATDAPGGYCTKACSSAADCGKSAYCYQTEVGPACLKACLSNSDCRTDYSCQGEAGAMVCYPDVESGGGDGGTAATNNSQLKGCFAKNSDITFQYWFDGVRNFEMHYWNPVSGNTIYGGVYQVKSGALTLSYSDGTVENHSCYFDAVGTLYIDDIPYEYSGAQCS
ncbi:MAG: hypothetical protein Kow0090_08210 [Myxococcota bacterium]